MSTRAIAPVVGASLGTASTTRPEGAEARSDARDEQAASSPASVTDSRPPVTGLDGKSYAKTPSARTLHTQRLNVQVRGWPLDSSTWGFDGRG